jgi:hypothetical protein
MTWSDVGRLACPLALWPGLSVGLGRGGGWGRGGRGAWFVTDGIAAQLFPGKEPTDACEIGRRIARVSLAVAFALVLVWGVAAVALCRGRR